jgi:hypothetical protein
VSGVINKLSFAAVLLASVTALININVQAGSFSCSPILASAGDKPPVEVSLRALNLSSERWVIEVGWQNTGDRPVFIMTDPVRADGSKGPYVHADESDSSVINFAIQVYPQPPFTIYVNHSGVKLRRLEAKEVYTQRFTLAPPGRATIPPYEPSYTPKVIDLNKIRFARVRVGILPDDEGVRDFALRKNNINAYSYGIEVLSVGALKEKRIVDIQTVVSSNEINLAY